MCDWDYHGLRIYERVQEIINNIPDKKFEVNLIIPNGSPKGIKETEENHSSEWSEQSIGLSGLKTECYNEKQRNIIRTLIQNNEWIEEEDNDFNGLMNEIKEKL